MLQYFQDRDLSMGFLLYQVSRQKIDKLYLPGFNIASNNTDLFKCPIWTFAGTFFIGDRKSIVIFNKEYNNLVSNALSENLITWEINFWHQVFMNNRTIAQHYHVADHKLSMFENLLKLC
jgi:hypothetical protein